MTILKWKNHPGLFNILDDMERGFFPEARRNRCLEPKVNILETEKNFEIQVSVPGIKKENINLMVEKNILTVSYERKENEESPEGDYIKQEFFSESFSRSFSVPESVSSDKIGAKHENGILKIVLPKKEEEKALLSKSIKIS